MKSLKNTSFVMVIFLILTLSTGIMAQVPPPSVEDEIIALTYKIWKAENENDMSVRNKYISDDYTEFNSGYSTRIDGKAKNFNLSDANFTAGSSLANEMLNPKVQVFGDVAILTYNYAGVIKENDGNVRSTKAKSTRVYVKMNGDWKLVHANFGYDPGNN
jgi:ketosteroid isomerase-like protein